MTTDFDQACIEVSPTLFLRLAEATGTTVVCMEGCLWVTRDGSVKDVLLSSGESYRVGDREQVIVSGVEPSRARVIKPAQDCTRSIGRPLEAYLRGWFSKLGSDQAPELTAG
jgi:hypothetical protein